MGRPKLISDNEILAKAFPVISREGFESFTIEQVANVTGLAPATLIQRFKTKKQLAFLARDWKWNTILSDSESFNQCSGLEGLFILIREISKSVDSLRLGEHMRLIAEDADTPELRIIAAKFFKWTREIIEKFILQAIESKHINNDVIPKELSFHIEALIQGSIIQFAFLNENDIEKHLIKQIHHAVKPYLTDSGKSVINW